MYNRNPNRKHPNEWTVDEVAAWLCSLENGKYARYKAAFIENEVDGEELKHLDNIIDRIAIKKCDGGILKAIQNLLNEHDDDDDTKDEVKTQSDNKDHRMNKPLDSPVKRVYNALIMLLGISEYTAKSYENLDDISKEEFIFRNVFEKKFRYRFISCEYKNKPFNYRDSLDWITEIRDTVMIQNRQLQYDALILCGASHGNINGMVCSDGSTLAYETIRSAFANCVHRKFCNIPKIFIFNCPRTKPVRQSRGPRARGPNCTSLQYSVTITAPEGDMVFGSQLVRCVADAFDKGCAKQLNVRDTLRLAVQLNEYDHLELRLSEHDIDIDDVVFLENDRQRGYKEMPVVVDYQMKAVKLTQSNEELKTQINDTQMKHTRMVAAHKKEKEKDQLDISRLTQSNKELDAQMNEERKKNVQRVKAHNEQKTRYESEVAELTRLNKDLKTQIKDKQMENGRLVAAQSKQKRKYESTIAQSKKEINDKQMENNKMIAAQREKKAEYESKVAELTQLNKDLKTQTKDEQMKHSQMAATQELEIGKLTQSNKELATQIKEKQKKNQQRVKAHNKRKKRYESEVAELTRLNKDLKTQIKDKQMKHSQMEATQRLEIEKLTQSNKELDTQIKEKQKEHNEQKREYESKTHELRRLSDKYKSDVDAMNAKYDALCKEKDEQLDNQKREHESAYNKLSEEHKRKAE
eukprot:190003_1